MVVSWRRCVRGVQIGEVCRASSPISFPHVATQCISPSTPFSRLDPIDRRRRPCRSYSYPSCLAWCWSPVAVSIALLQLIERTSRLRAAQSCHVVEGWSLHGALPRQTSRGPSRSILRLKPHATLIPSGKYGSDKKKIFTVFAHILSKLTPQNANKASAGWCSWLSRFVNTLLSCSEKVLGSNPSLVIKLYIFCVFIYKSGGFDIPDVNTQLPD